jgi:nucleoside-diphosphate-sugar epimerase
MPRPATSPGDDVVVAGGTGFVGSRLVERLLRRRTTRVWIVGRREPASSADPRVVFLRHDIARPLRRLLLPPTIRAVFHCASPRGEDASVADLFGANLRGTIRLLDYAARAGARHFVYVSSGGVPGYRRAPIREAAHPDPDSSYLRAKLAGELAVRAAGSAVPTTIVRLFFPYGPGQREGLLPLLCRRLARGESITVGPGGAPSLNPIHVGDAARLLARIGSAGRPDPVINLGGPDVTNVRDLARRLGEHLGRGPVFRRDETRKGHLVADMRLLRRRYGRRMIPLDRGLSEFAAWWRAQGG